MKKTKAGIKALTASIILATGLISTSSVQASTERAGSYGGWSESEGYFSNVMSEGSSFTLLSATKPDSHTGKRLSRQFTNQGDMEYAAQGITQWEGKYHYTTAQMENTKGTVLTTSGRKWDWDYTLAISPYYAPSGFENIEARTYWGY